MQAKRGKSKRKSSIEADADVVEELVEAEVRRELYVLEAFVFHGVKCILIPLHGYIYFMTHASFLTMF